MHARIPIVPLIGPPTSSLRQLLSSVRITGSAAASTAFQANFPLEYGPRHLSPCWISPRPFRSICRMRGPILARARARAQVQGWFRTWISRSKNSGNLRSQGEARLGWARLGERVSLLSRVVENTREDRSLVRNLTEATRGLIHRDRADGIEIRPCIRRASSRGMRHFAAKRREEVYHKYDAIISSLSVEVGRGARDVRLRAYFTRNIKFYSAAIFRPGPGFRRGWRAEWLDARVTCAK